MRKMLLAAALVAAFGGQAFAADSVGQSATDAGRWNGAYVGAQVGYGWGNASYNYNLAESTTKFDSDGFIGGLTAGYNWQRNRIVLGVEGDLSIANVDGGIFTDTTPCLTFGQACSSELNWYGTARVRAGYEFGNLLPYVTGGLAIGGIKGTADFGACDSMSSCGYDRTKAGWALGGGVEWAMNDKLSFKAEYLRIDLGNPGIVPNDAGQFDGSKLTFDTVRMGVNYHF
ncbi:outer membrane protein [Hoeflea sp. 108]|jgi:outer membrane immunogenic protein|uniref:outer membrane protein n=1 Tax=Hoeflea sp. 108 TaxID=1116369 RepID=UPI00037FDA3D|nr:outer membrane protein [Hoeflea sp. 108]